MIISQIKKRIITGLILGCIGVLCVLKIPNHYFSVLITVVLLLSAVEWFQLSAAVSVEKKGLWSIVYALAVFFLSWVANIYPKITLYMANIGWLLAVVLLLKYELQSMPLPKRKVLQYGQWLAGFFVLIPCCIAVNSLHRYDPSVLLYLLTLTYVADSAAYFIGAWKGQTKLCQRISPGKSLEGWLGATIVVMILALSTSALGNAMFKKPFPWYGYLSLGLIVPSLGLLGDLMESLQKRLAKVKDSGYYLPGHGGLLDRIDSVTSTLPIITLWLIF